MIPFEEQEHVLITEVKNENKLLKTEVVEEHVEDIKELQLCKQHEDKIATLVETKEVVVLKNCEDKVLGFKDEERVEGLKIGEVNQDFGMDLNEKKTDKVRYLKHLKVYNYSSSKSIYPKSSKMISFLKKEDYLGLTNRRSGSYVDLWECGKRVKIKVIKQVFKVFPTSKSCRTENTNDSCGSGGRG